MKVGSEDTTSVADAKAGGSAFGTGKPQDKFDLLPWLPCCLALDLPVAKFTVADLLTLKPESIVETSYHQSSDLPLRVNGQLIGWTEFEVVGERLAVRLTDLS